MNLESFVLFLITFERIGSSLSLSRKKKKKVMSKGMKKFHMLRIVALKFSKEEGFK